MIASILTSLILSHTKTNLNPDPSQVLKQIAEVRTTASEAQKRGEDFDQAKISAEQKKLADEALAQVDIATATPDECVQWVKICAFTNNNDLAIKLSRKAYGARAWDLLELERPLLIDDIQKGNIDAAIARIRNINFSAGPAMIGQFHLGIKAALSKAGNTDPGGISKVYDALAERVYFESPLSNSDRHWGPLVYADLLSSKYSILYTAGREDEALKALKILESQMARFPDSKDTMGKSAAQYVSSTISRLTQTDTQGMMMNNPAPEVVFDRSLGDFKSWEALKGKVILIDFMAHWCGPCKAALPDIIALNKKFAAQGLQVVSLTGYYGYYGSNQDLTPDQEYNEMKSFVKDYKMDWPVLFDPTQKNNTNYGVSGIPQLVVIDRKGNVRRIEIGYTPESFRETAKLVEKLISEAAN